MSTIQLRGPFAWIWGGWHVGWLFGLFVVPWAFGLSVAVAYLAVLYMIFAVVEAVGFRINRTRQGPEVVRTLSQFRQWVAQQERWLMVIAMGAGAGDAAAVCLVVSELHPVIGMVLGFTVAAALMPHYAFRGDVGRWYE
jgi:hypothetical protein